MRIKPLFGASLLATLFVACSSPDEPGGFAGTPAPTPSPSPSPSPAPSPGPITSAEGLWSGNTNTARTVTGIVLDDGTFHVLYTPANPSSPNLVAGVIQGVGTSDNGAFTSSVARDISFETQSVASPSVVANYVIRSSFNGALNYPGPTGVVLFNTTFNTDYDGTPSLAVIAGTYPGQIASSSAVQSTTLAISDTGAISSSSGSCALTGTVAPRSRGNVFNATLVFGGPPCLFAGQALSGIAYYRSTIQTLYISAPSANRTDGALFAGIRTP